LANVIFCKKSHFGPKIGFTTVDYLNKGVLKLYFQNSASYYRLKIFKMADCLQIYIYSDIYRHRHQNHPAARASVTVIDKSLSLERLCGKKM